LSLDSALSDLGKADPRASQALELQTFVGLSVAEIAEVLEVSRSTIARDLRKAKERLGGYLDEDTRNAREKQSEELFEAAKEDALGSDSPVLMSIYSEIKRYLARNPHKLYSLSPRRFEELVADILRDFGFDVELTPATRDGGCDIYAHVKNQVTQFLMLVECKRWAARKLVGVDIVQRVYGVQQATGANKSMIVTTSFFTKPARSERERFRTQMDLRDYGCLKEWLANYA
jgi:restriction endonuclease Mrr